MSNLIHKIGKTGTMIHNNPDEEKKRFPFTRMDDIDVREMNTDYEFISMGLIELQFRHFSSTVLLVSSHHCQS